MDGDERDSELAGLGRLLVEATIGVTDLVEAMHHAVTHLPSSSAPDRPRTGGISGLVYNNVRRVARVVGSGVALALAQVPRRAVDGRRRSTAGAAVLAALNGVVGDHLQARGNPLATRMALLAGGEEIGPGERAPAAAAGGKLLLLVHGLCMSERQWLRDGHDHGQALARDLGYTPLYLRYNSGLHIRENGRQLAALLERALARWPEPIDELVVLGHSMGALVARSACHQGARAGHRWLEALGKLVLVGAPHHGAPLEQGGAWLELLLGSLSYTAPIARLGRARSAGITDLRHGALIEGGGREPVPLPDARCYALAGSLGVDAEDPRGQLLGDGMVPVASALGLHDDPRRALPIPPARRWVGYGVSHIDLLAHPSVYAQIRRWIEE